MSSPIRELLGSIWELDDQYPIQDIHFNKLFNKLTIIVSPKTFADIDTDYHVGAIVTENKISYEASCSVEIIKSGKEDFSMADYANSLLGGMNRAV